MEQIPCAQLHSCMLLDSCLYVMSMNMFVFTVIIAVGMTNRRDQQKTRLIAFVVPFEQISDTLTTSSTRKFAQNSGSGNFRADDDDDDRTDYFTPLRMHTG